MGFPGVDKSAVATINRALLVCHRRSRYPGYFVKGHHIAPSFFCSCTMAAISLGSLGLTREYWLGFANARCGPGSPVPHLPGESALPWGADAGR